MNAIFIPKTSCSSAIVKEVFYDLRNWKFNFRKLKFNESISLVNRWTSNDSSYKGILINQMDDLSIFPIRSQSALKKLTANGIFTKIHTIDMCELQPDDILWLQM